jgi:hypothetical protein
VSEAEAASLRPRPQPLTELDIASFRCRQDPRRSSEPSLKVWCSGWNLLVKISKLQVRSWRYLIVIIVVPVGTPFFGIEDV